MGKKFGHQGTEWVAGRAVRHNVPHIGLKRDCELCILDQIFRERCALVDQKEKLERQIERLNFRERLITGNDL
jgi:hypothetical protein